MIKKSKAINSHSSKNNKPDAEMKLKTKNNTEYIELFDKITHKELIKSKTENIRNNKFSIKI